MTTKVSELIGAKLDYWTARADSIERGHHSCVEILPHSRGETCYRIFKSDGRKCICAPSTKWDHGGYLIEKHNIAISYKVGNKCQAKIYRFDGEDTVAYGHTPLIAAMRALVASVYGETVPEETAP